MALLPCPERPVFCLLRIPGREDQLYKNIRRWRRKSTNWLLGHILTTPVECLLTSSLLSVEALGSSYMELRAFGLFLVWVRYPGIQTSMLISLSIRFEWRKKIISVSVSEEVLVTVTCPREPRKWSWVAV